MEVVGSNPIGGAHMTNGKALCVRLTDGSVHRFEAPATSDESFRWLWVLDGHGAKLAAFKKKMVSAVWVEL